MTCKMCGMKNMKDIEKWFAENGMVVCSKCANHIINIREDKKSQSVMRLA